MPKPAGGDAVCGCKRGVALARIQWEMVRDMTTLKEEVMGAIGLLLSERGLGT